MATVNLGRVVGKSAYEVWLDAGNTGTEADYLESLKGEVTQAQLNAVTSQLAETADNAALWRTATSNPATCYPVPKSSLYPRIELVATQEGEGDPSPENIRPIVPSLLTGQKVKATRTGKNLFSPVGILPSTWSEISAGEYQNTGGQALRETFEFIPPLKSGVQYVLSFDAKKESEAADNAWVTFVYTDTTYSPTFAPTTAYQRFTVLSDPAKTISKVRIRYASVPVVGTVFLRNVQLELGSTATPYEPYSGADYDLLTAEQDFYGLPDAPVVVDAEAGTVTVGDTRVVLDGSADEVWSVYNDGTPNQRYVLPATNKNSSTAGMCSHYTNASVNSATTNIGVSFLDSSTAVPFRPDLTAYPNISAWKAYLAAQYAAGTPVVIQYQLATPITVPITPPAIAALERLKRTEARQNVLTVTVNDGTAGVQKQTVTYAKSPIRESDEIAAAIAALA